MKQFIKDVAFLMQDNFYELASAKGQLGATLLRDALIPDILGKDNTMLYWAGKRLARLFPLAKDEELPFFFAQANWGTLKRIKAKKGQQYFELTGEIVETRKKLNPDCEFLIEAGFLAETIQNQLGFITEAAIDKKTHNSVIFLVQIDTKDPLDLDAIEELKPLNILPLEVKETSEVTDSTDEDK